MCNDQGQSESIDFSKVKLTTDAIRHSREAKRRGDESNVVYLFPSIRGMRLLRRAMFSILIQSIIKPTIREVKAFCNYLVQSKIRVTMIDESIWKPNTFHYSYIYPATLLAPGHSIPTAHSYITVYDNHALQPTEPLDFLISYDGLIYALVGRYVVAVAHYESDWKTLRRIIAEEYWKRIAILVPSTEFVEGVATAKIGLFRRLDKPWT